MTVTPETLERTAVLAHAAERAIRVTAIEWTVVQPPHPPMTIASRR
jgi:hypothetical protein